MSQIDYIDDYTAMEIMSRQNAEPSATQIDFKAHGLNFTAIVISEDGNISKHVRPEIKCSESEIRKAKSELDRYQRALAKKEIEVKTLREKEDYTGFVKDKLNELLSGLREKYQITSEEAESFLEKGSEKFTELKNEMKDVKKTLTN